MGCVSCWGHAMTNEDRCTWVIVHKGMMRMVARITESYQQEAESVIPEVAWRLDYAPYDLMAMREAVYEEFVAEDKVRP